jgi:hypothetical protein
MKTIDSFRSHRTSECGQASVEYVVVCAAITFALGVGMVDSNSVLRQLLDAFAIAYQRFSFALSLPA